jgi:hypothetical protein
VQRTHNHHSCCSVAVQESVHSGKHHRGKMEAGWARSRRVLHAKMWGGAAALVGIFGNALVKKNWVGLLLLKAQYCSHRQHKSRLMPSVCCLA